MIIDGNENVVHKKSLFNLVQTELVSLSGYWLAALRDDALLTLPNEFASQLPHDGGTFYTNYTIEAVRPCYRDAWPPILEAASLDDQAMIPLSVYFYLVYAWKHYVILNQTNH